MSSSNIHVISPASKEHWQSQFIGSATSLDESGFPLSGSFGVSFSCPCNLAEPEGESLQERMVAAISTTQPGWTPRKVADSVRRLLDIYAALQPNSVVAFKEGKTIVAFVRILGPYFYEPTNPVSHRWNYKTIRKATATEANPPNAGGLIPTFRANYIPAPLFETASTNTVIEEESIPAELIPEAEPPVLEESIPSPPVKEEPTLPTTNWSHYIGIATVAAFAVAVAVSVIKKRKAV
jgi:hypothetical protein